MKTDLTKNADLQQSIQDPNFVLKTQQQIAKDLSMLDIKLPDNFACESLPKEEIERLITIAVASEMEKGEHHLLQLLYIIDLPEKQFLHLTTQVDFLAQLSEVILFREAFKVWSREQYSN